MGIYNKEPIVKIKRRQFNGSVFCASVTIFALVGALVGGIFLAKSLIRDEVSEDLGPEYTELIYHYDPDRIDPESEEPSMYDHQIKIKYTGTVDRIDWDCPYFGDVDTELKLIYSPIFTNSQSDYIIRIYGNVTSISFSATSSSQYTDLDWDNQDVTSIVLSRYITEIPDYAFASGGLRLEKFEISKSVKRVGFYAFMGTQHIKKIVIPDNATLCGAAFQGAYGLISLVIGDGVKLDLSKSGSACLFSGAYNLKDVVIGCEDVRLLGGGNSNLRSITFTSSVKRIFAGSFGGCCSNPGLLEFRVPSTCKEVGTPEPLNSSSTTIGGGMYANRIIIEDGVERVYTGAFQGFQCPGASAAGEIYLGARIVGDSVFSGYYVGNIIISDSVEELGSDVFTGNGPSGAVSPRKIVIPESVKKIKRLGLTSLDVTNLECYAHLDCINYDTFYWFPSSYATALIRNAKSTYGTSSSSTFSTNIRNIDIDVESIGPYLVSGGNHNIILGNRTKTISAYAFSNATLQNTFVMPDSITKIESGAFQGCGVFNVVLPKNLTEIPDYLFSQSQCRLSSVQLPEKLRNIGQYAFSNNTYLMQSLELPDTVENVGESAFNNCYKISSLKLNEGLKVVGNSAFYGFSYASGTVTLPSTLETIGGSAFYNYGNYDSSYKEVTFDGTKFNKVPNLISHDNPFYTSAKYKVKLRISMKRLFESNGTWGNVLNSGHVDWVN